MMGSMRDVGVVHVAIVVCVVLIMLGMFRTIGAHYIVRSCSHESDREYVACVGRTLELIGEKAGFVHAFEILRKAYLLDPLVARSCFNIVTGLGASAFQSGMPLQGVSPALQYCHGGFVRAYAERVTEVSFEKGGAFCRDISGSFGSLYQPGIECYRGVGVAVARVYRQDGMGHVDASVRSIESCEVLGGRSDEKTACVQGVFKEIGKDRARITPVGDGEYGESVCERIGERYRDACQGSLKDAPFFELTGEMSASEAVARTAQTHAGGMSSSTLSNMVRYATYLRGIEAMPRPDFDSLIHDCLRFEGPVVTDCVHGYASAFAKQGVPGRAYAVLMRWCEVVRERTHAVSCVDSATASFVRGTYHPDVYERICPFLEGGLHDMSCVK